MRRMKSGTGRKTYNKKSIKSPVCIFRYLRPDFPGKLLINDPHLIQYLFVYRV